MQVVTSFESGLLEETQQDSEPSDGRFDFEHIERALKIDLVTAENVFARCAKHHFRKLLGDTARMCSADETMPSPLWVTGSDVVVDLVRSEKRLSELLSDCINVLATGMSAPSRSGQIALIGALNTKILKVGPNLVSFKLRQKWGLDGK